MKFKSLILTLSTLILFGCNDDSAGEYNLTISTTDIAGKSFSISRVFWVYASDENTDYELECETETCNEWVLPADIEGDISVFGEHSVPFENDELCAEVYSGKQDIFIDSDTNQKLTLEIKYSDSLCQ